MSPSVFRKRTRVAARADDVFAWHARPGALERLTPPWEQVRIEDPGEGIRDGSRVVLRVKAGPFWRRWVAEHRDVEPGRAFRDVQIAGPFRSWDHHHRFEPAGDRACALTDEITYRPPLGVLGRLAIGRFIQRKLDRLFAYRHATTAADLAQHGHARLRVLVTGSSGLVGRALVPFLTTGGHHVARLVRSRPAPGDARWDPPEGQIDLAPAGAVDAVVHLAGESVASGRWSTARKRRIRDSRVAATRRLAQALAARDAPPRVLVTASGTGIYGDRGDEELTEASARGTGFLAEVADGWEGATIPAERAGIRVVHLRLGVVLTPAGGALPRLLRPFRLGLGGRLGSGRQYLPWIGIDDLLGVALHALTNEDVRGPVNTVAPQAVTNREFARTLGRVLRRPSLLPAPAWVLKLALGEMAREMLLAGQRAVPARLAATGFAFRHPDLETALRHLLGRGPCAASDSA